jgi:hypothetical protein
MVARRSRRALRHLKAFFDFSETAFPSLAAFMCSGSSLQLSVHPTGCHTANLRHKSVGYWKLGSAGGHSNSVYPVGRLSSKSKTSQL